MTKLVQEIQAAFCFGNNTQCARYSVMEAVGRKAVPELMLPNQHHWARQILDEAKKTQ
jgi:hypothetical protein